MPGPDYVVENYREIILNRHGKSCGVTLAIIRAARKTTGCDKNFLREDQPRVVRETLAEIERALGKGKLSARKASTGRTTGSRKAKARRTQRRAQPRRSFWPL